MPSGYQSGGVDLDSYFAGRGGTTAGPDTGYLVDGVDLSQRYRASSGGDQRASDVGYAVAGTDLRHFFRDIDYVAPAAIVSANYSSGATINRYPGDSFLFWATDVEGDEPITYTWEKDGVTISGETSTSLSKSGLMMGDAGTYRITASNSAGSSSWDFVLNMIAVEPLTASLDGPSSVTAGVFSPTETWTFEAHAPTYGLTRVRFYVDGHGAGTWTTVSGPDYYGSIDWADGFGYPSISNSAGVYTFRFEAEDAGDPTRSIQVNKTVTVNSP